MRNVRDLQDQSPRPDLYAVYRPIEGREGQNLFYVEVKGRTKNHRHKERVEKYLVVGGEGTINIEGEEGKLKKGIIVEVPKGMFHHVERTSKEPLTLLMIATPHYDPTDAEEREKTVQRN